MSLSSSTFEGIVDPGEMPTIRHCEVQKQLVASVPNVWMDGRTHTHTHSRAYIHVYIIRPNPHVRQSDIFRDHQCRGVCVSLYLPSIWSSIFFLHPDFNTLIRLHYIGASLAPSFNGSNGFNTHSLLASPLQLKSKLSGFRMFDILTPTINSTFLCHSTWITIRSASLLSVLFLTCSATSKVGKMKREVTGNNCIPVTVIMVVFPGYYDSCLHGCSKWLIRQKRNARIILF